MFAAAAATGTERIVWALSCSVKLLVGGGRVVAGELRRRTTHARVFSRERQAGAGAAHQPTDRGMRACVLGRRERERARDIDEAPDQFAQLGGGRWQIRHRHAVGSRFCGGRAMASHARGRGEGQPTRVR